MDENSYFPPPKPSNPSEATRLERVTLDEMLLLHHYRMCDVPHRDNVRKFSEASSSRTKLPQRNKANVIMLADPTRKFR